MALLVGIDEAGYGPVLGPLVVASAIFETPENAPEAGSLWERLEAGISRRAPRRGDRVWIADSKQVHQGHGSIGRLERNVLATCPLAMPLEMAGLLEWLGVRPEHANGGEPWHGEPLAPLPIDSNREAVLALRDVFDNTLEAAGMRFVGATVNVAQPRRFNRMVAASDNKAVVLWQLASDLLERAPTRVDGGAVRVTMDKQGGRAYYTEALRDTFPMRAVEAIAETTSESRYRVDLGATSLEVHIREKADDHCLPVALASMWAKYVRELFMEQFNGYWQRRVEGVRPTAGYWEDSGRWLAEMAPHLEQLALPREHYVRSR